MPLARAARLVGGQEGVEELGGLSGRSVVAVHGPRGSVVLKGPVGDSERRVATSFASVLAERGVPVAGCLAVLEPDDQGTWLILEHVPHALPRERWGADPDLAGVLRALHTMPTDALDPFRDRYRPRWDESLTRAAWTALGGDAGMLELLGRLAPRARELFRPLAVISGDPNPLNWRLDASGRLVLLDWERITLASPAVDLAIALPGFPDEGAVAAMLVAYGEPGPQVEDVLLAKAWTVVELAAGAVPGSPARDVIDRIGATFSRWLRATWGHALPT